MNFPRIVIAGTHSGSGKTTVTLSLLAVLSRSGVDVQPFKVGPDFIDASFHNAVIATYGSVRRSRNLDPWLMTPATVNDVFIRSAVAVVKGDPHPATSGLSLIEGVMGLYDGLGNSAFAGTAHVASLLRAPVILVVNAQGMSLSAAALVSGYAAFRPRNSETEISELTIGGVLLNRVSGQRHYDVLRACIEDNTGIPCLGYLPNKATPSLPSRHLGLVQASELPDLHDYWQTLAVCAQKYFDLNGLMAMAQKLPEPKPSLVDAPFTAGCALPDQPLQSNTSGLQKISSYAKTNRTLRIGLAYDEAFSFYYPDSLDMFTSLGAELVPFSPIHDPCLPPDLDGLYLGGGYPELHARRLEANSGFRYALLRALDCGLPAYAECGGLLYLCASLITFASDGREQRHAMSGFFPFPATMCTRLQPFGYVSATVREDCVLGSKDSVLPGHEFHYSRIMEEEVTDWPESVTRNVLTMTKADGRSWNGGYAGNNVLASYLHLHFSGCPEALVTFLDLCRSVAVRTM